MAELLTKKTAADRANDAGYAEDDDRIGRLQLLAQAEALEWAAALNIHRLTGIPLPLEVAELFGTIRDEAARLRKEAEWTTAA